MTNKRSIFFALILCLLSLGSLATASTPPPPPPTTVTVTDNFGSHGTYLRWDRFSTDLSASVANPPQSTTETTITGPTYNWAVVSQNPSSPTFTIIDSGNATLQSPIPSKNVCFVAGGGTYDVKVNCTITYTSTDNKTGVATPLGYSANPPLDVTFFVRAPTHVIETAARRIVHYTGPNDWGYLSQYDFELLDNQMPAQSYEKGLLRESFPSTSPSGFQPNGPSGGDIWNLNDDGTGTTTANWTDNNGVTYSPNPGVINQDKYEGSLTQNWDCMEATPPYTSPQLYTNPGTKTFLPSVNDTALVPTMSIKEYDGYAIRSFPGDPSPN